MPSGSYAPSQTYAKELISCGLGLPLWRPEPPSFGPPEIGDVGFVQDGCFYRLFNILYGRDHILNSRGVPPSFRPVDFDANEFIHVQANSLPPGPLFNQSSIQYQVQTGIEIGGVAQLAYNFSSNKATAAVTVIADPATTSSTTHNRILPAYMRQHHKEWYEFAESKGYSLLQGDIFLARGWTKGSNRWAIASSRSKRGAHGISFQAEALSFASPKFTLSRDQEYASVRQRLGPGIIQHSEGQPTPSSRSEIRDQTLFITYYKMKFRILGKASIVRQADPKDSRNDDDDDEPSGVAWRGLRNGNLAPVFGRDGRRGSGEGGDGHEGSGEGSAPSEKPRTNRGKKRWVLPKNVQFHDPLKYLLDYILQHSNAEVAIASHQDLYSICDPSNWPEDLAAHILQVKPTIYIAEGGLGQLFPPDTEPKSPSSPEPEASCATVLAKTTPISKSTKLTVTRSPVLKESLQRTNADAWRYVRSHTFESPYDALQLSMLFCTPLPDLIPRRTLRLSAPPARYTKLDNSDDDGDLATEDRAIAYA